MIYSRPEIRLRRSQSYRNFRVVVHYVGLLIVERWIDSLNLTVVHI